jgi:predicted adenylyl cyclase CyaB
VSRNVEIKGRITSVEALLPRVKAVADQGPSLAYGRTGHVEKHRTLLLAGRTRIHLDRVSGLGHFLELEVVLEENEPFEAGVREADELLGSLGVEHSQLIEGGYVDLLRDRREA